LWTSAAGVAEEVQRASELRSRPGPYMRSVVAVEGFVTQYVDAGGAQAAFFYVKDDWGGLIRVQTKELPPGIGRRYRVRGRLTLDTELQDPYLVEEGRTEIVPEAAVPNNGASAEEATRAGSTAPVARLPGVVGPQFWWVGLGLVTFVGGALMLSRRSRVRSPASREATPTNAARPLPPAGTEEGRVVEGKTIRLHLPPPSTVKILPGWLEVLSEESVRQVMFYRTKSQTTPTITFGRAPGEPYSHIQLKPMTVSARQAQVSFGADGVMLTNLATSESNPTKINDREMGPGETQGLQDNDTIAMGEVLFRFRAR
jgi:hypothetical protein